MGQKTLELRNYMQVASCEILFCLVVVDTYCSLVKCNYYTKRGELGVGYCPLELVGGKELPNLAYVPISAFANAMRVLRAGLSGQS